MDDDAIDDLLRLRREARESKNYGESDRIRTVLAAQGVIIRDTPQGQIANGGTQNTLSRLQGQVWALGEMNKQLRDEIALYKKRAAVEYLVHMKMQDEYLAFKYGKK